MPPANITRRHSEHALILLQLYWKPLYINWIYLAAGSRNCLNSSNGTFSFISFKISAWKPLHPHRNFLCVVDFGAKSVFLSGVSVRSNKYFYHKQIRKSEIIFLFFLAKDVVDDLLNSIHSYVGKNYAYTVIDLCRWFNAVRIGSNDAIKFLIVTSRLSMKYELLVITVIVIRSFHENTWRILI